MAALSPLRFFTAWRVEAPFPRFPVPMGSTLCALFDSVRPFTFSVSAVVLAPAFCFFFVVELWLLSLSSFLRGLSQLSLQSSWVLQRLGIVELFAVCTFHDFLTVRTLFFNSAAFCSSVVFFAIFCIRATSHRCHPLDSVSARTWFSHSRRRPLVLVVSSVLLRVRVSDFVLFCGLGCLACIIALLLLTFATF